MNDEVSRAEVDEAFSGVDIREERLKHSNELIFTVLFVDQGLLLLDGGITFSERLVAVLLAHVLGEVDVRAGSDVDHLLLFVSVGLVDVEALRCGLTGLTFFISVMVRPSRRLNSGTFARRLLLSLLPIVVTRLGQVLYVLLVLVFKELRVFVEFLVSLGRLVTS